MGFSGFIIRSKHACTFFVTKRHHGRLIDEWVNNKFFNVNERKVSCMKPMISILAMALMVSMAPAQTKTAAPPAAGNRR